MLLYHILTFNVHGHTKIINFKYQLQHGRWNEEFELPNRPYSVSDIQQYFKNHETVTYNLSIMIYVGKIENKITFKKRQVIILNF